MSASQLATACGLRSSALHAWGNAGAVAGTPEEELPLEELAQATRLAEMLTRRPQGDALKAREAGVLTS